MIRAPHARSLAVHPFDLKAAFGKGFAMGGCVDLEEKAVVETDDVYTVTGYASVFNNRDLGDDIVLPGAFQKSLDSMQATGRAPLFLFNHKMHDDAPIGTVVEAKEDKRGLWFKAELPKDDSFVAGRIVPQLKRRGLKGVSIGYRCRQSDRKDGARLIKQADLIEISLVNMPMNPLAAVEMVKSDLIGLAEWNDLSAREREVHLKSLGLSDELAKRIVSRDRDGRGSKGQREAANPAGIDGLDYGLGDLRAEHERILSKF